MGPRFVASPPTQQTDTERRNRQAESSSNHREKKKACLGLAFATPFGPSAPHRSGHASRITTTQHMASNRVASTRSPFPILPDARIPVASFRDPSVPPPISVSTLRPALTSCPGRGDSAHRACRCRRSSGRASRPDSTCRAHSARRAECRLGSRSEAEGTWHCLPTAAAGAHRASRAARLNDAHRRGIRPAVRCVDHAAEPVGGSKGLELCASGNRG